MIFSTMVTKKRARSANECVTELGFNNQDIAVLVGQAPLAFAHGHYPEEGDKTGSQSPIKIPDWLKIDVPPNWVTFARCFTFNNKELTGEAGAARRCAPMSAVPLSLLSLGQF
jgi:hypothetical protein